MAIYTNLIIDQGSVFEATISVVTPTGNVMDLTGYQARGYIKKTYTSKTSYPLTVEISTIGASRGEIYISLTSEETRVLKPGRYVFDIEVYRPLEINTTLTRVLEGQIEVTPSTVSNNTP